MAQGLARVEPVLAAGVVEAPAALLGARAEVAARTR
jgi:hypothetical protein